MTIDYRYILPPIVGAVIGWLTNFVAIKLLFRPHLPINVLGFKIQGLIPKRRKEIAQGLAHTIENELLSSDDLASTLNNIDFKEEIEKSVEEIVEHRIRSRVKKIPLVGVLSDSLTYHIKYIITKEMLKQLELKKDHLTSKVASNLNIKEMLSDKIDKLDVKKFEKLLTDFIARELRHIEWLGGVMGFFIGVFQVCLFYFLQ